MRRARIEKYKDRMIGAKRVHAVKREKKKTDESRFI